MIQLTKAMQDQLLTYCRDAVDDGSYYGNQEQFYKRHNKIVAWILEQEIKK
jgi:hypothetical protein